LNGEKRVWRRRGDFVVYRGREEVPEKVQVSRDVDRLVTIKARVKEKIFSFSEASASFQAERFFCSG
jgi:predicted RNase H-like nuclease (RuvC/YqgF family)